MSDVCVAIAGSVDSGKSSTLGRLISGKPDDGRGSSRLRVFNFSHEEVSGRSSSVAQHILGFDEEGKVVYSRQTHENINDSWRNVVKNSKKIITFYDLCGHEKYLKTTIGGITSHVPDFCIITVGANMGFNNMAREHFFLCATMKIPVVIVITKIDICEERQNILKETIRKVKKSIKSFRRKSFAIKTESDLAIVLPQFEARNHELVPIFQLSNVSGDGFDLFLEFLRRVVFMPISSSLQEEKESVVLQIETTFHISGIGLVVGGQLHSGSIKIGDSLFVGPINKEYHEIIVKSIHVKRTPVEHTDNGKYVCLGIRPRSGTSLNFAKRKTLKGRMVVSDVSDFKLIREFVAEICVMKTHHTSIKVGFEPVIHTGSIRQTCKIITLEKTKSSADDDVLRSGDRGIASFKFLHREEYISIGDLVLFTEGHIRVVGKVIKTN